MEIIAAGKKKKAEQNLQIWIKGLTAWAVGAGFLLCLVSWMEISITPEVILLFLGAGVIWHSCVVHWKYGTAVGILSLIPAVFVVTLGCGEQLLNGFLSIYNASAETLGRKGILLLTEYELLSDSDVHKDIELFTAAVSVCAGWFSHTVLHGRRKSAAVMCGSLTAAFLCVEQISKTGILLMAAGTCVCAAYLAYHRRNVVEIGNSGSMTVFTCAAAGLLLTAAVWSGGILLPKEKYMEPEMVSSFRNDIEEGIDRIRYKKQEVNTLPKGNLLKAETWETTENTALRVTMSEPASLYLRGYVGSVYESDRWTELSSEVYYEKRDLFYWLEQWGFSGTTQLAQLREHLKQEAEVNQEAGTSEKTDAEDQLETQTIQVKIENINADSEYFYVPYELAESDEESGLLQEDYRDGALRSDSLFGSRAYSYTSYGNLVKDFPQAAAQSYLYRRENQDSAYTEAESYYNVFVYQNYTQLPARTVSLLKKELGFAGGDEEGHADYRSVISKIRNYLQENITYGNYAEPLPEDKDFLQFFLTESKIGNSVHYATAAALMFRYYGIPARYAEGYLITLEDAENAAAGIGIEIPGSRGHAWTEIYVDGLGWVPIEMTPEYYDWMEQPDLMKGLQADSSVVIKPPQNEVQEPDTNRSEDLKERLFGFFLNLGKILLWILICFDLFCLLVFLFLLIRRMTANVKRHRLFGCRDNRTAICSMTGYMTRLVQETGDELSQDAKSVYQSAYKIGEKAAFSCHEMSAWERITVADGWKMILKELKRKKGWYEKWILKYIERLY